MFINLYRPDKPEYYFNRRGKERPLELIRFYEHSWLIEKMQEESRRYGYDERIAKHINWLLERGETRPVPTPCYVCLKKPAVLVWVEQNGHGAERQLKMSPEMATCKNDHCQKSLQSTTSEKLKPLPIRFSSLDAFETFEQRLRFGKVLKDLFNLNGGKTLMGHEAFDFFAFEPTPEQPFYKRPSLMIL